MHSQQFDIKSINKAWFDSTLAEHKVNIDGYELIRKDRNRNCVGIAIFVRSSINFKAILDLMPINLEIIIVEVLKPRTKSFLINTWYRPPDAPLEVLIKAVFICKIRKGGYLESISNILKDANNQTYN